MSVKNAIRPIVVVLFILTLGNLGTLRPAAFGQSGSDEIATQPPPIETMADMEALFAHEPSYQEVQQVAMRYAEVHPEKIASWRSGASLRAFLPRVDYDYDWRNTVESDTRERIDTRFDTSVQREYGVDQSIADNFTRQYDETDREDRDQTAWELTERYSQDADSSWSSSVDRSEDTGTQTTTDRGSGTDRDTRWRVRLTWDLRDFLYNDQQPRISTEARRLVELRQDVLQEINTYFFDRRRAQIEMLYSPPDDVRSKIDLQLQVARVTASIDALTGGYLSAELEKSKSK
ncbi:MAG: hypothetical protein P9M08_13070 [Candidatus Erginobacter occultus]|nr:hypothetical protein [Candidatus Erginobacter occultus]